MCDNSDLEQIEEAKYNCQQNLSCVCMCVFVNNMFIYTYFMYVVVAVYYKDLFCQTSFVTALSVQFCMMAAAQQLQLFHRSLSTGTCILVKCIAVNRWSSCTTFKESASVGFLWPADMHQT